MPPIKSKYKAYMNYINPSTPLSKLQRKQVSRISIAKQEKRRVVNTGSVGALDSSHYIINPLYNIPQGVTSGSRVSNQIYLDYIYINVQFNIRQTPSVPVDVWMYAFWSDVESITSSTTPTQVTTGNVLTTLPMLGDPTSTAQSTLLQFDPFQCTPIWSKHFTLNPSGYPNTSTTDSQRVAFQHKLNFKKKKITYLHDSASYNEGKNLYIGFTSSSSGTVDATSTVAMYHNHMVVFRE
jgi:hypothetical protein